MCNKHAHMHGRLSDMFHPPLIPRHAIWNAYQKHISSCDTCYRMLQPLYDSVDVWNVHPYHMMRCTMLSVCFGAHINQCSPEKLVHEVGEPLHSKIRWHDPILQGLAEFSQVSQPTWQMNNPIHTTQRNWQRCVDTWSAWLDLIPDNESNNESKILGTRWQAKSNLAWSYC